MAPVKATLPAEPEEGMELQKKILLKKKLRKTSMCAFFLEGNCKYGSECDFAHHEAELQQGPDLSKTRLCEAFRAGNCSKRDCRFAHGLEDLRPTGFAFKTSLCVWYAKGTCTGGSRCRFAHGHGELRRPDEPAPPASGAPRPGPRAALGGAAAPGTRDGEREGGAPGAPTRLRSAAMPFVPGPMKVNPVASSEGAVVGLEESKSLAQGLADISCQLRRLELRMEALGSGGAPGGSSVSPPADISCQLLQLERVMEALKCSDSPGDGSVSPPSSTCAGSSDDEMEEASPSRPPGLELWV